MMGLFEIAIVVLLLVALVLVLVGRPGRHEGMKTSMLGMAMIGLQKILQPIRIERILEEKNKLPKESTDSGDHPPENSGTETP